ncbi:MAG: LapA family protein [Arenicellales bacterium]
MKVFLYLLLALMALLFGISFVLKNSKAVEVTYYFGLDWSGSLSALLVITLAAGALLGVLFTLGWVVKMKRQVSHARRELAQLEREASSLRPLTEREVH